ncbi:MAG: ComEC/Rec2 family competence protein [Kiloniellales bacterium]|nr:ComEC/Rec2 family competence protein [Kiloniellales bacterium]
MAEVAAEPVLARLRGLRPLGRFVGLLAAESGRASLWLPVCLGLGIAGYFALPQEPPSWLLLPLGLGLLALVWLVWQRAAPRGLASALGMFGLGLFVAMLRTLTVAAPVLTEELGPGWVSGRVVEVEIVESRPRVLLRDTQIAGLPAEATPARLRLRLLRPQPGLRPGDLVRLRAVLRPPPEPAAPGAFDFARRAYFQRLGAVGYAVTAPRVETGPDEGGGRRQSRLAWAGLRQALAQRITVALDGIPGAVAVALITGDRSAIPEGVLEDMRASGLAHLLAISGLHLGLVAGLVFFAARAGLALIPALALRFPIKKWAAVLAAAAALIYLFLVGATIPTQRAYVMVGLALLAVVLDRQPISLRLLAAAAALILLLSPESLLSASFQMSFAAVTALVAGYEWLSRRRAAGPRDRRLLTRLGLYLGFLLLSSVIANLATAPFAIFHFNRLAVFGLFANLVAIPLTAFWIMPAAVVAMLLLPFGLEAGALAVMGTGIELLLAVAGEIAGWEGAVIPVRAMPLWGLAAAAFGGLWLCLWERRWRLVGLAGPLLGAASIALTSPPDFLVSGDGRLLALRAADGALVFSALKRERYRRDIWLRRSGAEAARAWDRGGGQPEPGLRCDALGCVFEFAPGRHLGLALTGEALEEDCRTVEVLVSLEPLRGLECPEPRLVIDRFDLWRNGTHAVWLNAAAPRVASVRAQRGDRPWVRKPEASSARPAEGQTQR